MVLLLQRTFRTLAPLSSSAHRPFIVYTSSFIRRIHVSRILAATTTKEKAEDSITDAVLRDIIQQTSIAANKWQEEEKEATNLLITLDALGTLYEIKNKNVGFEYRLIAKECGLKGLSDGDVNKSFKKAFKELTASHPNYGYATGMTPKEWWEQITIKTFTPLIPPSKPLPGNLAESLWNHFSTNAAYSILPGTLPFLWNIKDLKNLANETRTGTGNWKFRTITIGVISNSDDRVVDILNSMDIVTSHRVISQDGEISEIPLKELKREQPFRKMSVGSRRTQKILRKLAKVRDEVMGDNQVMDFAVTSCKIGYAKPQKEIFEAARKAAEGLVAKRFGEAEAARGWEWYHVGDSPTEDVLGAYEAGAVGVLYEEGKPVGDTERIVEGEVEGEGYRTMVIGDLREVAEFTEGLGLLYRAGSEKVKWSGETKSFIPYPRR